MLIMDDTRRGLALSWAAVFALTLTTSPIGSAQVVEQDALALEEVVVTARKSSESLLDVPLAITAFTAEAIEARGIANLDDVASFTPGLTFSNVLGDFLPAPVIRGVAPIDIFGELNTAIFFDGVFVSGREGINFNQLDLERIEVVKGPQASLYGRNAFSGAINYVSAKPGDVFKSRATLTAGRGGQPSSTTSGTDRTRTSIRDRGAARPSAGTSSRPSTGLCCGRSVTSSQPSLVCTSRVTMSITPRRPVSS
jgi:outer membrane receptor protein involved in Fe transport